MKSITRFFQVALILTGSAFASTVQAAEIEATFCHYRIHSISRVYCIAKPGILDKQIRVITEDSSDGVDMAAMSYANGQVSSDRISIVAESGQWTIESGPDFGDFAGSATLIHEDGETTQMRCARTKFRWNWIEGKASGGCVLPLAR